MADSSYDRTPTHQDTHTHQPQWEQCEQGNSTGHSPEGGGPQTRLLYVNEGEYKAILEESIRPKYRERKYSIATKRSATMDECFKKAWCRFLEEKAKTLPEYYIPDPPPVPLPPPLPPFIAFQEQTPMGNFVHNSPKYQNKRDEYSHNQGHNHRSRSSESHNHQHPRKK